MRGEIPRCPPFVREHPRAPWCCWCYLRQGSTPTFPLFISIHRPILFPRSSFIRWHFIRRRAYLFIVVCLVGYNIMFAMSQSTDWPSTVYLNHMFSCALVHYHTCSLCSSFAALAVSACVFVCSERMREWAECVEVAIPSKVCL